jgi:hypothetical protein
MRQRPALRVVAMKLRERPAANPWNESRRRFLQPALSIQHSHFLPSLFSTPFALDP